MIVVLTILNLARWAGADAHRRAGAAGAAAVRDVGQLQGVCRHQPPVGQPHQGTFTREIGILLPNNQRQRRTCYALFHILYPVSGYLGEKLRL
jgi:hypothetical protein